MALTGARAVLLAGAAEAPRPAASSARRAGRRHWATRAARRRRTVPARVVGDECGRRPRRRPRRAGRAPEGGARCPWPQVGGPGSPCGRCVPMPRPRGHPARRQPGRPARRRPPCPATRRPGGARRAGQGGSCTGTRGRGRRPIRPRLGPDARLRHPARPGGRGEPRRRARPRRCAPSGPGPRRGGCVQARSPPTRPHTGRRVRPGAPPARPAQASLPRRRQHGPLARPLRRRPPGTTC